LILAPIENAYDDFLLALNNYLGPILPRFRESLGSNMIGVCL